MAFGVRKTSNFGGSTGRRPIVLFFALPLWAGADAQAIIERLLLAQTANGDRIQPYTYVERAVHFTYSKDGKLKRDFSETREVIFVEGLPFHKLVARNDKPLPAKEQAEVRKAVNETAEERRRHPRPPAGGQLVMGGQRIDVGDNRDLLTLFENRVDREEEIRGHKTWVMESTPHAGSSAANEHEREVLSFRRTLWIDQAEYVPVRVLLTVVGDGIGFAMPGSTIQVDYEKIAPDVWSESGLVLDIRRRSGKEIKPWKRTEYTDSNFKKFDVQSTVTVIDR
jgi:hypothetical protein